MGRLAPSGMARQSPVLEFPAIRYWAMTTVPASGTASAPFCVARCCARAFPPSTTTATPPMIAIRPTAKMTRICPGCRRFDFVFTF